MSLSELIKNDAIKIINGSVIKSNSGIDLFTPDGLGDYPALWTRDFAYMIEYAGDLFPLEKQRACIEYLIDGARESDGWIPDKVFANGAASYTAGENVFNVRSNLDNGAFLILAADTYLSHLPKEQAKEQFDIWKEKLCRGITCLDIDENGLVLNPSDDPHSPYGFTDVICKTGKLAMESLLLWRALKVINKYIAEEKYIAWQRNIEQNFASVFSSESGMLYAATEICHQIDIWASCYAVSIDFPLDEKQKKKIADWLVKEYDSIVLFGQIRQLPKDEYWEKTFMPLNNGEYQNGAYWATATGWFCDAIVKYYPELANKTLTDVVDFFKTDGVWECINYNSYRKLKPYVVSITNVYGICKKYDIMKIM